MNDKVPAKVVPVTEQMYEAGMTFLAKRGTAWSVKDLYTAMDAVRDYGCQCRHCTVKHASDCAVHNEPAYPAGKCDCAAAPQQGGEEIPSGGIVGWLYTTPAKINGMSHRLTLNNCYSHGPERPDERAGWIPLGEMSPRSEAERLPVHGAVTPVAWKVGPYGVYYSRHDAEERLRYLKHDTPPQFRKDAIIQPLYEHPAAPVPVVGELVERLELPAFIRPNYQEDAPAKIPYTIANGFRALCGDGTDGLDFNKENCRCDPGSQEQPPFHCEYCAIHNALHAGKDAAAALERLAGEPVAWYVQDYGITWREGCQPPIPFPSIHKPTPANPEPPRVTMRLYAHPSRSGGGGC